MRADHLPRHLHHVHGVKPPRLSRHPRRTHKKHVKSANARVGVLARELGVESWRILAYLFELGKNSDSVGPLADKIREHFRSGATSQQSPKPTAKLNKVRQEVPVNLQKIPEVALPFELLPPGTWDVERVDAYYRDEADHLATAVGDRGIDPTRVRDIINYLKPFKCYRGKEQWLGYHAFEFAETIRVALECPIKGNATYVLWGDWQRMAAHPKRYVWKHFPHSYVKIVHKGHWRDWIGRIRSALGLR